MLRNEEDIRHMLTRFDDADEQEALDEVGQGIRQALIWVAHTETSADDLEQYLPEEEVCEDCNSPDCSGAAGGECDDIVEDEEDLEGGQYRH